MVARQTRRARTTGVTVTSTLAGLNPWANASHTPQANHRRLTRYRGAAKQHSCVDCGEPARDWSWIHNTNPVCHENYEPRCRRCHVMYDGHNISTHIGVKNGRAILSEDDVLEIRKLHRTGGHTRTELAAIYGISVNTLKDVVAHKSWKHLP